MAQDEDAKSYRPPALDTIEDDTKILAFDKLYKMALEHYIEVAENGEGGERDDPHYIYEECMKRCLGKDIFKHYNKLVS